MSYFFLMKRKVKGGKQSTSDRRSRKKRKKKEKSKVERGDKKSSAILNFLFSNYVLFSHFNRRICFRDCFTTQRFIIGKFLHFFLLSPNPSLLSRFHQFVFLSIHLLAFTLLFVFLYLWLHLSLILIIVYVHLLVQLQCFFYTFLTFSLFLGCFSTYFPILFYHYVSSRTREFYVL